MNSVSGQSISSTSNSNSIVRKDSTEVANKKKQFFASLLHALHLPAKKEKKDTSKTVNKKTDSTKFAVKLPHPPLLKFAQGSFTLTSLYTQGVSLNTGVTGLYNLAHISQSINVAGIPIVAEATGVMDNGQFMKDYSSYSIGFDSKSFMNALEKRAQNDELSKIAGERSHLPNGQHMNLVDSMKSFDSVRAKLTSPSYQAEISACENRFKKLEDSISKSEDKQLEKSIKKDTAIADKSVKDSLKKDESKGKKSDTLSNASKQDTLSKSVKKDTTELHSLRQKIAAYEKLEKRYELLFQLKKNYSKLTQADSAATNDEKKYDKYGNSLTNPNNAVKELEQNKLLKPYEKILSGFQYINIGHINEEMSDFTLHNFMMNGVSVGYKTQDDIYISGGYGKEQAIVNPYLLTGVDIPNYNRTVEYGSAGIGGQNESNLYATVIDIHDPGSLYTLSETNLILDISKKIVLFKNLDITGELSHSYFSYLPNKLDSAVFPNVASGSSDLAYAIKAHGIIPGINTDIKLEYLNAGTNYVTLGNQFLMNGTSTYRAMLKQKLSKKLSLELGGGHIVQNQNSLTATQGTDNWLEAGIKYKPLNALDLEFNYSPRQYQQQEGAVIVNSLTNNINQLSLTGNARYSILDRNQITTLYVGNFQCSTPDNTTYLIQNINLAYYMVNQTLMLNGTSNLNFTGDEARNSWTGSLTQFIGQGTYNMSIGKTFMFSAGLQWIEQPGIISNGAGIIGSLGKTLGKWGRLALQLNCRNDIDNLLDMHTGQIILSTNASIFW